MYSTIHATTVLLEQASLVCKLKGRGISYRSQASREAGQRLFTTLLRSLHTRAVEALCGGASNHTQTQKARHDDSAIPPHLFFRSGENADK